MLTFAKFVQHSVEFNKVIFCNLGNLNSYGIERERLLLDMRIIIHIY